MCSQTANLSRSHLRNMLNPLLGVIDSGSRGWLKGLFSNISEALEQLLLNVLYSYCN